ncbi:MAG: hypothetical protein ACRENO_05345 [Thermodesulfobacteriota bacterium]
MKTEKEMKTEKTMKMDKKSNSMIDMKESQEMDSMMDHGNNKRSPLP